MVTFRDFVEDQDEDLSLLECLSVEELQEVILEASWNPLTWPGSAASSIAQGIGKVGKGIYNLPNQARAGFYGIDTNRYKVGSPEFQRELQAKQYNLDPAQFTSNGNFDQNAWNKAVAKQKFNSLSPEQQQSYWQTRSQTMQDRLGQQANVMQSKAQYQQAKNQYQAQTNPGSFVDQVEKILAAKAGGTLSPKVRGSLTQLRNALANP